MAKQRVIDRRVARFDGTCGALPDATRGAHGDHAWYDVRGKKFAYFLSNHHGDGIVAVCVKTLGGSNVEWVGFDPSRYYLPAYIGSRGWLGVRMDRGRVDWDHLAELIKESYRAVAPKRLAATVSAASGRPRPGGRSPSQRSRS